VENQVLSKGETNMADPIRISAVEARQKVIGGEALFVCAYQEEEKFRKNHLQGAISLDDFKAQLPSLTKEQEIIFY
jgi:hypothetical protein